MSGKSQVIFIGGADFGDGGKGRVVNDCCRNLVADRGPHAISVFRASGGANAGHTIYAILNGMMTKIALHLLPCGITERGVMNVIGCDVLVDLDVLTEEIELAEQFGSLVMLDPRAPLVTPLDKMLDKARDKKLQIGTTGRGIGPARANQALRMGPRLGDMQSRDKLATAIKRAYDEQYVLLRFYGVDPVPSPYDIVDQLLQYQAVVKDLLGDTVRQAHQALANGDTLLFEGAQGILLDPRHGTYPYVTSSPCGVSVLGDVFGIHHVDMSIGVVKAYSTRVGNGPFPTELFGEEADRLRNAGAEFGATTGRPRRPGWFDAPLTRYAARVGGFDRLFITKLDVLDSYERIPVCVDYKPRDCAQEGHVPYRTLTTEFLEQAAPEYVAALGWKADITSCRALSDLPSNAIDYLRLIRREVRVPITGVSVGPNPGAVIWNLDDEI